MFSFVLMNEKLPALPINSSLLRATTDKSVLVGFSGGLDSTVLLHLLVNDSAHRNGDLRALHIHHGLQEAADDWAQHCQQIGQQWGVPVEVVSVRVDTDTGMGVEAAARQARHQVFAQHLLPGHWLALAHHLDDQAETFLLRALRGSGIDGLAAMQPLRDFAHGQLWRPLLNTPRAQLVAYAQHHQLRWIDDPSNNSHVFERNFLRHQIMPLLSQRWPHAAANFARSADLSAQSARLLSIHDTQALKNCLNTEGNLAVCALKPFPSEQQARLLRLWVQQRRLPALPAQGVRQVCAWLASMPSDRQPVFHWQNAFIRYWRGCLYADQTLKPWPPNWQTRWNGCNALNLPDGGVLELQGATGFDQTLTVCQRQGGERIELPDRAHSHKLKNCLQTTHIPPWLRDHLPLLCEDSGYVLAAGDQIISARLASWLAQHQARLHWQLP